MKTPAEVATKLWCSARSLYEAIIAARDAEVRAAALEEAANEARRGDGIHDPSERIAQAIRALASGAEAQPLAAKPAVVCYCGRKDIPAGIDAVNWYWQRHGRNGCTLELPDRLCPCGLLRSEHISGHANTAASPQGKGDDRG